MTYALPCCAMICYAMSYNVRIHFWGTYALPCCPPRTPGSKAAPRGRGGPPREDEEARCAILERMSAFSGAGDLSAFEGRGLHELVDSGTSALCRDSIKSISSFLCLLIVRNLCVRIVLLCTLLPASVM
eukprot:8936140-Pyramimonas_sp.AAC.1